MRCQGAVLPRWKAPGFSWNQEQSPLSAPPGKGGTQCPGEGTDGITGGCLCSCSCSSSVLGSGMGTRCRDRATPKAACHPLIVPLARPEHARGVLCECWWSQGVPAQLCLVLDCQFQRNPQRPPARPGVIHQKCERNSAAVGVPGSEWALGGGTIPAPSFISCWWSCRAAAEQHRGP